MKVQKGEGQEGASEDCPRKSFICQRGGWGPAGGQPQSTGQSGKLAGVQLSTAAQHRCVIRVLREEHRPRTGGRKRTRSRDQVGWCVCGGMGPSACARAATCGPAAAAHPPAVGGG